MMGPSCLLSGWTLARLKKMVSPGGQREDRGARAAECHLGTGVRQISSCSGLELALRFLSGSTGGGIPGCLEEICR